MTFFLFFFNLQQAFFWRININQIFGNPDFDFYQFSSNLVFRIENRPGSQFYLVWSQDRTEFLQSGSQNLNGCMSRIK
jgi:hypothetical protein